MTTTLEARIRRIVCDVVVECLRVSNAPALLLLDDDSPAGDLLAGWLSESPCAGSIWRVSVLASNVHGAGSVEDARALAAARASATAVLVAHPANKTALLLDETRPRADLFPFGDLYATQLVALVDSWAADPGTTALAVRAGGIEKLDEALRRLVDERQDPAMAVSDLPGDAAAELLERYDAGRYFRTRPRTVPKLGSRTIGVDLFD